MDEELYDKVADSIVTAFNTHDARADFLDCVVRFATHDFMDVVVKDNKVVGGGMDSCMDFDNPDNFGLYGCMDGDDKMRVAYSTVCSDVSFADFAVIAAEALMAATSTYPSETRDAFKKNFMWGRSTSTDCKHKQVEILDVPPNPEDGCDGLSDVFIDRVFHGYNYDLDHIRSSLCTGTKCVAAPFPTGNDGGLEYYNMSKAWYLTAALSGVHTMWRAKPQNAGYDGPRVEEGMFNNGYYKAMLNYGWVPQKGVCGNPDKNQWSRIDSLKGVHGHRTGEMMQDSDMCLAYGFKDGSRLSAAESERCCMWTDWRLVFNEKITAADFPPVSSLDDKATGGVYPPEEVIVPEVALPTDYCGFKSSPSLVSADPDSLAEHWCCREHAADERGVLDENNDVRHCNDPKFQSNHGPAFYAVHKFAKDESAWLNAFMEAWWIGTTNGYDHKLHFLRPPTTVPYFVPQESCRLLPSEKECADAGCAWAGSLCSAGTEFSWGVVWNELSMLSREQPPEPPEPSEPPEPPEPPAASDYDRSDDANRHILKADTACAKCAPHKNDNTNCCAFGGAWEGMCDEGGQHTWSEGFRVCNSPEADYIAATGEPLSSSDEETVEAMREGAVAAANAAAAAAAAAACGLCGRNPDHINAPNCCSVGGAWEGLCDEGGQHTWSEGFHACNSPGANNVAAPAPAVKETREPFYPRPPPGKVTVHGDPMFKHDGIGLKFSIPLHKPTELLGWRGKRGEAVSLLGTAYERENSKHTQWFNSFALTVDGRELFNVSTFGSQREQLSPHGSLRLVVDGKVHTVSPEDVANFATIIHPDTSLTLSMLAKKFRIGNKRAQSLKVRTTGNVTFSVYSSGATKYQDKKEQYKYRHLNVRLDSGMPDGATGIFAQMAGVVPMTPATRKMLSAPKRFDALMKRQRKHRVRAQKGRKVRAIAPDEAW